MSATRRAALAAALLALAAAPADADRRPVGPDLVVQTVAQAPAIVAPGGRIRVTDTVRNSGARAARSSRTRYVLIGSGSPERLRGRRAVPRLAPGAESRGAAVVAVGADVAPGSYRLLACADARRQVQERRERNNCRYARAPVRVDPDAPSAPVVLEGPADPTNATSARFAFTTAPATRATCALDDGSRSPCASPLQLAAVGEGEHRLTLIATDPAGNASAPTVYDWTVDVTPPATPALTARPDPLTARTAAELRFDVDDDATARCQLDDGATEPCTSPARYDPLADGTHTFTVTARDGAGNRSAPLRYDWTVDSTAPPAPGIDDHPDALSTADSARFAFSEAESGTRLSCRLDEGSWEPCTSPQRYDELEEGAHRFTVAALDAAGNRSAASFAWTIVLRPAATTGRASPIQSGSAGLTGTVAPPGNPTTYWFEYGTTSAYGSRSRTAVVSGTGTSSVGITVTDLAPQTTYHYRLVATTCGSCARGTVHGADETFTTLAAGTYQNPVFGGFPDPMALLGATEYYVYGTGSLFPILRSSDLVHWTQVGTALRTRPTWVPRTGEYNPWAPSVLETARPCPGTTTPAACFYLYYTGLNSSVTPNANCIGVAIAPSPEGPFSDLGILDTDPPSVDAQRRPIGCGDDGGYSNIDPAPFVDPVSGAAYLYLSTGHDASGAWSRTISVIPLTDDLTHAAGARAPLFGVTREWEHGVVEGPWMARHGSAYYLFYSGGVFTEQGYGMGYALGDAPDGPFSKASANPVLAHTDDVFGPGGGSVVRVPPGGDWMIYHARAYAGGARTLRIDPLVWDDSDSPATVSVDGPSTSPRPLPSVGER